MSTMFSKKIKSKLEQYEDPTGEFTSREFKLAEWYIHHKANLRKIWILILVSWCTISVIGSLLYWGYYFSTGYFQDQDMASHQVAEIQNYEALHVLDGAQDLQINNIEIYQSASNKYDLVAQVANPNERWAAIVTYNFSYNDLTSDSQTTVVLPKAQRPLIIFGQTANSYPLGAKLQIQSINWKKISPHDIVDVDSFVKERTSFSYENFKFTPASRLYGASANTVAFDVINDTPYSYWHVDFYVKLIQDEQVVGYAYIPIDRLMSKETRHAEKRIMGDNVFVTDIQTYPVVNVFDGEAYILPT